MSVATPDSATHPSGHGPTTTPPWVCLFNRPGFLALRDLTPTLHVLDEGAAIAGVRDGDAFVSGVSAPYGGFDLARDRCAPEEVGDLVDALLARLKADGVRRATIRLAPEAHAPRTAALVQFALLNRGFRVAGADLASCLDLRALSSADEYRASLRSPARRALKHADAEPFTVGHAADAAGWDAAWALLDANRSGRGRELSLDRAYVERLRTAFPDEVRMLELRHDGRLVAAAFSLRVRPGVEFVSAWGDAHHDLPRSPMNRLALAVVERSLGEGVRCVDLGTSTLPGSEGRTLDYNPGLSRFKSSIGADAEVRYVLEGEL